MLPPGVVACRDKASPFTRRLAKLFGPNRVHLFCIYYGLLGSLRCFPPHLAVTQLLQVLSPDASEAGWSLPLQRVLALRSARAADSDPPCQW